jgi:hypothetical protein
MNFNYRVLFKFMNIKVLSRDGERLRRGLDW